jgi:hypothetical protein
MVLRGLRRSRATAVASGLVVITAGTLVSASGVLANATPAGPQAVRAHLAYSCRFPTGRRAVSVTVAGTFPSAAVAGQPIKVTGVRTTVAFPPSAAAGSRRLGTTAVTGRDVLNVAVADNAKAVTARWPGRAPKPARITANGRLRLAFSGAAPPVTPSAPGTVTFTAAGLTITLVSPAAHPISRTAHPISRAAHPISRTGHAIASTPAALPVACTLVPGKGAELAAVPVTAAAPRPGHSAGGRHRQGLASPSGKVPPGCVKRLLPGSFPGEVLGCAHLIGYADVQKLEESALVGPAPDGTPPAAFLNVETYASDIGCVPPEPTIAECTSNNGTIHVYSCTVAQLDYHKQLSFPPAKVTFLNFGFVPVTAVMQLSETTWPRDHPPTENHKCYTGFNKNKPVHLTSPVVTVFSDLSDASAEGFPVLNISETYLTIHISQVAVNGVPLDVGPDCGTTQPVHAVLTGHGHNGPPPTGYTLATGGPLSGTVTIPKLVNCGVGENLDPLFDASISGPMNFQLMTQGTLCTPQDTQLCPPTVPKPRRHL